MGKVTHALIAWLQIMSETTEPQANIDSVNVNKYLFTHRYAESGWIKHGNETTLRWLHDHRKSVTTLMEIVREIFHEN